MRPCDSAYDRDNETVETDRPTGLRRVNMENLTHRNRRSIGETMLLDEHATLADVAMFMDETESYSIQNHGGSGHGACAFVEAVFDDEDPDDEDSDGEDIEWGSPLLSYLPLGAAKALRQFISAERRSTVWNGNNHVPCITSRSEELLARIRQS